MTRRRFYAPPKAFDHNQKTVQLDQSEARHLRDVLRLRGGDEVYVFDGCGREHRAQVSDDNRKNAVLTSVESVEPARPESPLQLTLAIALLKGDKFDLVVQKATELGVTRIVPVLTVRSDVRLPKESLGSKRVERWNRLAMEAAKQSGRAFVPTCAEPVAFQSLVSADAAGSPRLLFTEREGRGFDRFDRIDQVTAMVGPEGGWADEELDQARANGWILTTLGGRILRAETAAITVAALVQHRFGDLQ